jgi:DNA replication initiation complex subunit (GINS family)
LEEEINYKSLRKIQEMEKKSPLITDLTQNFYNDLTKFLKSLDNRLENEKSPQKTSLLKNEIQNISKIALNIYELREKKILLAAVSKVRGGNPELKNLTDDEKNLFNNVLTSMKNTRGKILNNKKKNNEKAINNLVEENPEENEEIEEKNENNNPIARVTQNIPEFIGTDKNKYTLRKDDILSLPKDMSEMLLKRGAIEKIE